jgi:hypothetical protein
MTMHEAEHAIEITETMRRLAATPRGSRLTLQELEVEATALVDVVRESARPPSQVVESD